jgi:hypothetical protein
VKRPSRLSKVTKKQAAWIVLLTQQLEALPGLMPAPVIRHSLLTSAQGQGGTWRLYLRRVSLFLNVRHWTALVARQLRTKPGIFSAVDALPGYKLDSVRNMLKGGAGRGWHRRLQFGNSPPTVYSELARREDFHRELKELDRPRGRSRSRGEAKSGCLFVAGPRQASARSEATATLCCQKTAERRKLTVISCFRLRRS